MLRNRPEILMLLSLIKLPTDSTAGPGSIIFQIEYPAPSTLEFRNLPKFSYGARYSVYNSIP